MFSVVSPCIKAHLLSDAENAGQKSKGKLKCRPNVGLQKNMTEQTNVCGPNCAPVEEIELTKHRNNFIMLLYMSHGDCLEVFLVPVILVCSLLFSGSV